MLFIKFADTKITRYSIIFASRGQQPIGLVRTRVVTNRIGFTNLFLYFMQSAHKKNL